MNRGQSRVASADKETDYLRVLGKHRATQFG